MRRWPRGVPAAPTRRWRAPGRSRPRTSLRTVRSGRSEPRCCRRMRGVLTHCNAGALACVGYGTALGVIRAAHESGRGVSVWVGETRPVLQGARLTAWELAQLGIPFRVIVDAAAGSVLAAGAVDAVVVGADRVAANGDVANKIGTYALAVLADAHAVPFYVAAPSTTVDAGDADRRRHPHRTTRSVRGVRLGHGGGAARRHGGAQPCLRHHPGTARHRVDHRAGRGPPPRRRVDGGPPRLTPTPGSLEPAGRAVPSEEPVCRSQVVGTVRRCCACSPKSCSRRPARDVEDGASPCAMRARGPCARRRT